VRGVIFAGGKAPGIGYMRNLVKDDDYIICLDSGLEYANRAGITPSVILGDFDSVDEDTLESYKLKGVPINSFPARKDFTDMELGIGEAIRKGVNELVIIAALGGRIDHTLGNIDNMAQAVRSGISTVICDEKQHLYMLSSGRSFHYKKGTVISLIPFTSKVEEVTTHRLSYPLNGETLVKGYSRGISNVFLEDMALIEFKSGILQVVVNI